MTEEHLGFLVEADLQLREGHGNAKHIAFESLKRQANRVTKVWGIRVQWHSCEARIAARSRFFCGRDRHACNLQIDSAEIVMRSDIEGFPVVAAERQIGRVRIAVHDAAKLLAVGRDDVEPA